MCIVRVNDASLQPMSVLRVGTRVLKYWDLYKLGEFRLTAFYS